MALIRDNRTYLTAGEVAKILSVSRVTALRWTHEGRYGPGNVLKDPINGRVYIAESALQALQERFEPVTSPNVLTMGKMLVALPHAVVLEGE